MQSLRQQAFVKFDANLYNFEKKRQTVDNKNKEKEIKDKEKEKMLNSKLKNENINKIQINFKNSFVNDKTHEKYDRLIENNNQRNKEKIEKKLEKEETKKKVEEENVLNLDSKIKNNQDKLIIKETDTINDSLRANLENMEHDTLNDITCHNKTNNESEMIFIESVSYFRSRINDYSRLNDTQVTDKQETLKNTSLKQGKYEMQKIIDETLQYESEDSANGEVKNEIKPEKETQNKIDTVPKLPTLPTIPTVLTVPISGTNENNSKFNVNNNYCKIEENQQKEESDIEETIVVEEEADANTQPSGNKLISQIEDTYDKFLVDSLMVNNDHKDTSANFKTNSDNSLQNLLKQQMKNIITNIKDRKKDQKQVKGERKKLMLDNLHQDSNSNENKVEIQNLEIKINTLNLNLDEGKDDKLRNEDTNSSIKLNPQNPSQNYPQTAEILTFGKENKNMAHNLNPDINDKFKTFKTFNNSTTDIKSKELKVDNANNNKESDTENYSENIDNSPLQYEEEFLNDEFTYPKEEPLTLDEKEVTYIHKSIQLETEDKNENNHQEGIRSECNNIDLDEFIRENTREQEDIEEDLINYSDINKYENFDNKVFDDKGVLENQELEFQEIEPYNLKLEKNDRVLIFENYQNPQEYEEKVKKLEKLKERKIKDIEKKREKSRPKTTNQVRGRGKNDISDNSINITQYTANRSNLHTANSISSQNNSYIKNKEHKKMSVDKKPILHKNSNKSNSNKNSRTPIKIVRDEAQIANKKVKSNVNFTKLSNKKTIKSAISSVCLAGEPNRSCREKILEIIEKCPCENYIILFKANFGRFDLKAIYTFNSQTNRAELLTCLANSPIVLESHMIAKYYKYDLIQKDFKLLAENKDISVIVDGVSLISHKN